MQSITRTPKSAPLWDSTKVLTVNTRKLLVLLALIVGAWSPALQSYTPVADDLRYLSELHAYGYRGFIASYFHENGIWRIVGHTATTFLASTKILPPIALLALQFLNAALFYQLLRRAGSSFPLAWASLFAVCPFGLQANLWMSAFTYVLTTTWVLLLVTVLYVEEGKLRILLAFSLAFLSLVTNECLLFVVVLSGIPLLIRTKRWFPALAPIVAGGAYAIAQHFTGVQYRQPHGIYLRALISPLFHQPDALRMFGVWTWSGLSGFDVFFTWLLFGLLIAVSMGGILLLFDQSRPIEKARSLLPWVVAGLFATGTTYVLGGGYSTDSRKRYVFVPLIVTLFAIALPAKRWAQRVVIVIVICSAATTWVWCRLWEINVQQGKPLNPPFASDVFVSTGPTEPTSSRR